IGLVLIFYFIYTLSKITEGAAKIGYLSTFRYADVNAIDPAYKLDIWNIFYFTGLSLLLTGISYRLYRRRDIYI
ncbi:MAG: hypothetical protein IH593_08650, partial [Bacteroidales bacterium]|nr:hypothetical protein [Bacteroidales bacterium]